MIVLYFCCIGAYMLLGLALFEYAFAPLKNVHHQDEARDSKYPAFRRTDSHLWSKNVLRLGAALFLPLRLGLFIFNMVFLFVVLKVVTFGHDFTDDEPLVGLRK